MGPLSAQFHTDTVSSHRKKNLRTSNSESEVYAMEDWQCPAEGCVMRKIVREYCEYCSEPT
jgi:hypothetical protein